MAAMDDKVMFDATIVLRGQTMVQHHHKEQMAMTGALIYITGSMALAVNPEWIKKSGFDWLVILGFLAFAICAFVFVIWQFRQRHLARDHVKGYDTTIREYVEALPPSQTRSTLTATLAPKRILGPVLSEVTTFIVMGFSTLIAIGAVVAHVRA